MINDLLFLKLSFASSDVHWTFFCVKFRGVYLSEMISQLPVVPRLYQVSNAYSLSTTPIAVSSLPIQSHPSFLENLIFFGKIAGMTYDCLPV